MSFELLTFSELSSQHLECWAAQHTRASQHFACPLLRPEFVEDVAALRDSVRVIVHDGPDGLSFLPVSLRRRGVAHAPAEHMSDFEAIIGPGFDIAEMLAACRLSAYRFGHLLPSHGVSEPARWVSIPSPFIDLSEGFESYRVERLATRGRLIKEIERKLRKAERDFESVEFRLNDTQPDALEWLIREKSAQLHQRNQWDFLAVPWSVPLYDRTLRRNSDCFCGLVSTFRYEGRIVAAHFGLRSGTTLHSWTHCFDSSEKKTSPGMSLQYLLAKHCAEAGITRIDLGRGDEDYKPRFANGQAMICEGAVERNPITRVARRSWYVAREAVRQTPIGVPTQSLIRQLRIWKRSLAASAAQYR